jgi:SAM-dependent methyltransferase
MRKGMREGRAKGMRERLRDYAGPHSMGSDPRSTRTLAHYDANARAFWEGTRDHDVSQNYDAFLRAMGGVRGTKTLRILDLGCGPGRDLLHFKELGHEAIGLDGSARFVEMARELTGSEVLHQDFLALSLGERRFDGIFANASLFHVPTSELPRVLRELHDALEPRGVLFASNPHGDDQEGFSRERYGAFLTLETWRAYVTAAGFAEIEHYYRPEGRPRSEQPWLATVWRRTSTLEEAFDAGARLFDDGRYWDAHEAWEERWRIETREPARLFLQGLIQVAAAFHKKVVVGDAASAARLAAKARAKLDAVAADASWSPATLGVDLESVRAMLDDLEPRKIRRD